MFDHGTDSHHNHFFAKKKVLLAHATSSLVFCAYLLRLRSMPQRMVRPIVQTVQPRQSSAIGSRSQSGSHIRVKQGVGRGVQCPGFRSWRTLLSVRGRHRSRSDPMFPPRCFSGLEEKRLQLAFRNKQKRCRWHVRSRSPTRGKKKMFVADEKIRLAQFALQDALTRRSTRCANLFEQNFSRRRWCRVARIRLEPFWGAELQQLREKVNELQNLNTELQGFCSQTVGVTSGLHLSEDFVSASHEDIAVDAGSSGRHARGHHDRQRSRGGKVVPCDGDHSHVK